MMFLDSPSQFASVEKWKAWREELNKLNPYDKTVVAEKKRAERIISQRQNPIERHHKPIPD
jgi:hypothetical protein